MIDTSHRQNSSSSKENLISLIQYYAVFVLLIPALVGLVGANFQGTNKPLTDTHAVNLWSCVLATLVFCLTFAADTFFGHRRRADCSRFFGLIAIVSGFLSTVSLISMLLSRLIGYTILCLAWILFIAIIVVNKYGKLLKNAFGRLFLQNLKPFFFNVLKWFEGDNNNNM